MRRRILPADRIATQSTQCAWPSRSGSGSPTARGASMISPTPNTHLLTHSFLRSDSYFSFNFTSIGGEEVTPTCSTGWANNATSLCPTTCLRPDFQDENDCCNVRCPLGKPLFGVKSAIARFYTKTCCSRAQDTTRWWWSTTCSAGLHLCSPQRSSYCFQSTRKLAASQV